MDQLIEFEIETILRETDLALLLIIDGLELWLPKSQIEMADEETVSIPKWLALEKGLVD